MSRIEQNLREVIERMEAACERSGRPMSAVQLVGVSKKQPANAVQEYIDACAKLGVRCVLGENYVQEYAAKEPLLTGDFTVHFIGHLQSNKVKQASALFDVVQSVDSVKLAHEIVRKNHGDALEVMLEVNISRDEAKFGFLPDVEVLREVLSVPGLKVIGLMTITEYYEQNEQARVPFRDLASLAEELKNFQMRAPLLLSMGMSADFELAIEEGATHIRLGTVLFGERAAG